MKLELAILAGAESKQFLVDFTKQIDRLEKVMAKGKAAPATAADEDAETETDDDDDDFVAKKTAPKKGGKKAAASFDDDEETDTETEAAADDDDDDQDFTSAPAKKAAPKAPKITVDDVNDACKAKAKSIGGKDGRNKVLALLKKNFGTESVSEIEPENYAKVIKVMKV